MADDDADGARLERVGDAQDVEEHGAPADMVEHLRDGGFHPSALTRGEDQHAQLALSLFGRAHFIFLLNRCSQAWIRTTNNGFKGRCVTITPPGSRRRPRRQPCGFPARNKRKLVLEKRPEFDGNRVRHVLKGAIGHLPGRHAEDEPFVACDHLHVADHEAAVERDRGERLKLVLLAQMNADFGNLQDISRDSSSNRPSRGKPGAAGRPARLRHANR